MSFFQSSEFPENISIAIFKRFSGVYFGMIVGQQIIVLKKPGTNYLLTPGEIGTLRRPTQI